MIRLDYQCSGCGAVLKPERNIINVTPARAYSCDGCAQPGDVPLPLHNPEHSVTVTALPYAEETNHPGRIACVASCEQLATINWHFAHANGESSDNPLCPQHAAEWMRDYATPDNQYWLGH